MRSKNSSLKIRLYLIGAFILIAGLAGSVAIYVDATEDMSDVISYEVVDGTVYVTRASDSKVYRHDLERFGGKAAVFADDLNRWFAGLWRGKQLAYTVAVFAIGIALAFFLTAYRQSDRQSPGQADDRDGRTR